MDKHLLELYMTRGDAHFGIASFFVLSANFFSCSAFHASNSRFASSVSKNAIIPAQDILRFPLLNHREYRTRLDCRVANSPMSNGYHFGIRFSILWRLVVERALRRSARCEVREFAYAEKIASSLLVIIELIFAECEIHFGGFTKTKLMIQKQLKARI